MGYSLSLINKYCTCQWLYMKKSVRKKYNYTCQICGLIDYNIPIHHKIPLRDIKMLYNLNSLEKIKTCKLVWDENWLIPLCKKCEKTVDNPKLSKSFHEEYSLKQRRIK
jgi:5-methylcytosine-specific restriction endonuclease McrA